MYHIQVLEEIHGSSALEMLRDNALYKFIIDIGIDILSRRVGRWVVHCAPYNNVLGVLIRGCRDEFQFCSQFLDLDFRLPDQVTGAPILHRVLPQTFVRYTMGF